MSPVHYCLAITVATLLVSCKVDSSHVGGETTKNCAQTSLTLQSEPITYYKDIYPILTSSKTGEVYKCGTCHAHYLDPEGIASVDEVNAVVESVRAGRMPEQGDKMKEEYIQKFIDWRLTGFAPGDRSQIPVTEVDPSVYSGTADQAGCQ